MKTKRNLIRFWLLSVVMLQAVTGGAQPATEVAAGQAHSLFLKSDGSLWGMGQSGAGALGDGGYNFSTNQPEQILASNVMAIAAGNNCSLFIKTDGSLWGMGGSPFGALGDGTYVVTNWPEQIVASNVTAIAAGASDSFFLKSDGSLWGMGNDASGQLGDGTNILGGLGYGVNRPELIVASNVTAIAVGGNFSSFLRSDGSLWAMGGNTFGQLGDGTYNSTNLPEQIVGSNVTAIAAGSYHSLFLKSDGSLWAMGNNGVGQLGDGTTNNDYTTNQPDLIVASNVVAIAAGYYHSLFIKNDGSLWAVGDNTFGQLGDGTYNQANLPEQIVASGVVAISAGQWHSLFLKSDGSLWAMGDDNTGQLGSTTGTTNRPERIVAGPPGYGYNQMSIQLLSRGDICSYFGGTAGTNYALDRSSGLIPPNWVPQATNPANVFGVTAFSNTPDPTTNNFWRIRSVP